MGIVDGIIESVADISASELQTLKTSLPVTTELIALFQKFSPIIAKAGPLVDQLMPLYNQARPLITEALLEWKQLAPALAIVLRVVNAKVKSGTTLTQAVQSMADEYPPQAEI